MLFLLFQLGKERYALEATRVVEVVPLLALKQLPQAPKGVAGIFNYRGRPVPAGDGRGRDRATRSGGGHRPAGAARAPGKV